MKRQRHDAFYYKGHTIVHYCEMTKNAILFSVVVVLFVEGAASLDQAKPGIYWTIQHTPISYGTDVQLVCNITCCIQNANESASWAIKDLQSLSLNLDSTNDSKYSILTSKHACRLKIKNFGPDDANKVYVCFYKHQHYSRNLTLDALSFENQPDKDAISVRETETNGRYMIYVDILNAFPEPVCEAAFDHANLTSALEISSQARGILVDVKIKLNFDIKDGDFSLKCRIGTKTHVIKETKFRTTNEEKTSLWKTGFVIMAVLFVIALLSIVIILYRNKNAGFKIVNIKRLDQDHAEGTVLLPVNELDDRQTRIQHLKSTGRNRCYSA